MIKLTYVTNNDVTLIRSHEKSMHNVSGLEISNILQTIRQGTKILVETANTYPVKHRGDYYLLYMAEYDSVYLFYLDVNGNLRIVYSGPIHKASDAIYSNVADSTELTILKSDAKKAYRVAYAESDAEKYHVISGSYKNKSSENVNVVYMTFFEAINYAVMLHKKTPNEHFVVISPKNTVMFRV